MTDMILRSLRVAARGLLRRPGFTALALVTIALGIGANTAIFTVVNAVLLRPLPYPDPGELVMVWEQDLGRGWDRVPGSAEDFLALRATATNLGALAAIQPAGLSLTGGVGEPEQVPAARVTGDFFRVFEVAPALGRAFDVEANVDGAHRVTVLSHGLWERRYGADPAIVGRTVQIDGEAYEVLGVMPRAFQFPSTAQLWVPIVLSEAQLQDRNWHFLMMVGRLAEGAGLAQAAEEVRTFAQRQAQDWPESNEGWTAEAFPLHAEMTNQVRSSLWILAGAVAFVLLIACANVANLLLVRATGRTRELAVRTALGAGRGRIAGQLLTESVLLAGLGAVLGLLLAYWALGALVSLSPITVPGGGEPTIDLTVLGLTAAAALLTGLAFGLAPVLAVLKTDLQGALRDGDRGQAGGAGGGRLRSGLVVAEIALALVLVTGAGLMIQSVRGLLRVDVGIEADGLAVAQFNLPPARYPGTDEQTRFYQDLLDRAAAIPGVEGATLTSVAPPAGGGQYHVRIEGVHDAWTMDLPVSRSRAVTPGYFEVMGIPLIRGRGLDRSDRAEGELVVVVDEAFSEAHFSGEDPIGRQIRTLLDQPRTIVGVVGNVSNTGLGNAAQPTVYFSSLQAPFGTGVTLVVRAAGDAASVLQPMQQAIWEIDGDLPLTQVSTMPDRLADQVADARFQGMLLGLFAALALLLAGVGIYGVLAYVVNERTRELGLRMALGATRASVRGLVVRRALGLAAAGIGLGVVASLALGRVLSSLLFGIEPTDPWTLAGVALVLLAVSLVASYLPAHRASRLDPQVALRAE